MFDKKWSTIKHYKAQAKAHILPALGSVPLSQLDPHRIQSFYNSLLRGKGRAKPLSPKSIRNIHGILSKCLSTAVKLEYMRRNPAEPVTLPRVVKKEIKHLTDEQVRQMVAQAGSDGFGTLFKVVVFTGLRLGEALGLTWDCVDFQKKRLIINKQLQKRPKADGGFVFAPLKNDKTRAIAPAPFVLTLLKQWQQRQMEDKLRAGGAPQARVHDLRHTFAVLSIQNGDDVKTVQGNLGHATATFTLDVYGHVSEKMK